MSSKVEVAYARCWLTPDPQHTAVSRMHFYHWLPRDLYHLRVAVTGRPFKEVDYAIVLEYLEFTGRIVIAQSIAGAARTFDRRRTIAQMVGL